MADENESTPMQVDAPPPGDEPISKAGHIAWRTVNVIAAILAIIVLIGAASLPSFFTPSALTPSVGWRIAGLMALFGGLFVVLRKNNFSLLVLALACVFFFVSCTANFRWGS